MVFGLGAAQRRFPARPSDRREETTSPWQKEPEQKQRGYFILEGLALLANAFERERKHWRWQAIRASEVYAA